MSSELSPADQIVADKAKVRDLNKSAEWLSAWEASFLTSIAGMLERGRILSDKQRAVLDKLVVKAAE